MLVLPVPPAPTVALVDEAPAALVDEAPAALVDEAPAALVDDEAPVALVADEPPAALVDGESDAVPCDAAPPPATPELESCPASSPPRQAVPPEKAAVLTQATSTTQERFERRSSRNDMQFPAARNAGTHTLVRIEHERTTMV